MTCHLPTCANPSMPHDSHLFSVPGAPLPLNVSRHGRKEAAEAFATAWDADGTLYSARGRGYLASADAVSRVKAMLRDGAA